MWKSDLVLALQCSSSVLGRESQIPHGRPWLKSQPSGLKNTPGTCICVQDPAGVGWRNGGAKDDCMTRPTVGCSLSLSPPSDVTKKSFKKEKEKIYGFFHFISSYSQMMKETTFCNWFYVINNAKRQKGKWCSQRSPVWLRHNCAFPEVSSY